MILHVVHFAMYAFKHNLLQEGGRKRRSFVVHYVCDLSKNHSLFPDTTNFKITNEERERERGGGLYWLHNYTYPHTCILYDIYMQGDGGTS